MNQTTLKFNAQPTVLHLCGWSGTGKSFLLERFAVENPGSIQRLVPSRMGDIFEHSLADFQNHAAVAIDDVCIWERNSLVAGVSALELVARANGKKLILVTETPDDVPAVGVLLATEPLIVHLHGRQDALDLRFDGRSIHVARPTVV